MAALLTALKSIVDTLTLNSGSTPLMAISIALGLVAAWFAFSKITAALKFPMNVGWRPVVSLVSFIVITLLAAVLAKAYGSQHVSSGVLSKFLPLIVAVAMTLAAVAPLACFLMKSHYLQTLFAFLVPIVAATIVAFLVQGAAGAIKQGGQGLSKTRDRTEGMDAVIVK